MLVYLGIFLIAFSTLALEVTLTRLLSVITWYHLAFFAIATAMLGMTAGAVTVYLKPDRFRRDRLYSELAKACLWYAAITPVSLIVLCLTPLQLKQSIMSLFALLMATIACMLPFFFSGIVIAAVLTKSDRPIGKLYAADLIGASLGCLLVLGGLEVMDAPSLVLLCAAVGALSALSFGAACPGYAYRGRSLVLLVALALAVVVNSSTVFGIAPFVIKGSIAEPDDTFLERWNSYSRVVVHKKRRGWPQYWGPSPLAPRNRVVQYRMEIDGAAGTAVRRFASMEDIEHLKYDVTNTVYYLRPTGEVCVIGVGGGRDIQAAILFGHEKVTGIELNPIFVDLLEGEFRAFAGIADRAGVSLIAAEARSFLSRNTDRYAVIQMSLVDTWAATGAGAFSLSENALYTTEAWQVFINRLEDRGIFTVSRWYDPGDLGETGRSLSLAVDALLELGVSTPSSHIAMVASRNVSTLLIGREAFSASDVAALRKVCADLRYKPVVIPGEAPSHPMLRQIVAAESRESLRAAVAGSPYNYTPPTDENPYFFNMLRLRYLGKAFERKPGVTKGNLIATLTLLGLIASLFILTTVTVVVPLLWRKRLIDTAYRARIYWSRGLYFSLIGAGFMFIEIGLIQRLSVFLGHPVYALGILLFTIIASTGIGSFLSERLPLTRSPGVFVYPVATILGILAVQVTLPEMMSAMVASGMLAKIGASVLVIFPLGVLLGFFFPIGLRLVRACGDLETPWYWALNGIFGVLASALAVFFAIFSGISTSFYIAALCYSAVLPCLVRMQTNGARAVRAPA